MKFISSLFVAIILFFTPTLAACQEIIHEPACYAEAVKPPEQIGSKLYTITYHIKCDSPKGYNLFIRDPYGPEKWRDLITGDGGPTNKNYEVIVSEEELDIGTIAIQEIK